MTARVFSVEEADHLIGEIKPKVDSLAAKKMLMQKHHDQLLVLDLLGGDKIQDRNSQAGREYLEKSAELEALVLSFEEEIIEINRRGCFLKNIEQGIVDFYHVRDKHLVCLCWKRGEEKVCFWHGIDESSAVRQPLGVSTQLKRT